MVLRTPTFNIELSLTMLCLTLHIILYYILNQASSPHFSHPVMVQGPYLIGFYKTGFVVKSDCSVAYGNYSSFSINQDTPRGGELFYIP